MISPAINLPENELSNASQTLPNQAAIIARIFEELSPGVRRALRLASTQPLSLSVLDQIAFEIRNVCVEFYGGHHAVLVVLLALSAPALAAMLDIDGPAVSAPTGEATPTIDVPHWDTPARSFDAEV